MPDDVDMWAERVAIAWANFPTMRRTLADLSALEEQLGAHYLNRSVDEALAIVEDHYNGKNNA